MRCYLFFITQFEQLPCARVPQADYGETHNSAFDVPLTQLDVYGYLDRKSSSRQVLVTFSKFFDMRPIHYSQPRPEAFAQRVSVSDSSLNHSGIRKVVSRVSLSENVGLTNDVAFFVDALEAL